MGLFEYMYGTRHLSQLTSTTGVRYSSVPRTCDMGLFRFKTDSTDAPDTSFRSLRSLTACVN